MSLIKYGLLFIVSTVLFTLIDLVWLGFVARGIYQTQMGHLMRMANGALSPNIPAALLTWAVIVLGQLIFVFPLVQHSNIVTAFFWGGLYGAILYGTYDLTNLAVLARWPLYITVVDIAWGIVVNGLSVVIMTRLAKYIL